MTSAERKFKVLQRSFLRKIDQIATKHEVESTYVKTLYIDEMQCLVEEFFEEIGLAEKLSQTLLWRIVETRLSLEREALTDPLTEVPNLRAFHKIYRRYFDAISKGRIQHLSLICFDLDHFKAINDTFGHPIGDKVLRKVAEAVIEITRPLDFFARTGGEEFCFLIQGSIEEAKIIAERIRKKIEGVDVKELGINPEKRAVITASLGVTTHNKETDERFLIHRADRALYEAKNKGRNCVVIS